METTQMDNGAHSLSMKPELEAGGTMQKSLYRKSELEAGNTTKKSHPIAEDRIAELDAEAQATQGQEIRHKHREIIESLL